MKKHLAPLTGIRGVAALWVVLYHLRDSYDYGFLKPLLWKGDLGVDLFFILSGFIISHVYQHEFIRVNLAQTMRFLVLRCARILPVHYAMLSIFVTLYLGKVLVMHVNPAVLEPRPLEGFIYNVLNIHAWGVLNHFSWNISSWSVSAEWFAYLSFPLICPLIGRVKGLSRNLILIAGLLTTLGLYYTAMHMPAFAGLSRFEMLSRVFFEFAAGCALFNIYKQTAERPLLGSIHLYGAIALCMVAIWLHLPVIFAVIWLPFVILSLAYGISGVSSVLSTKVANYLGETSFSVYMVHTFVIEMFWAVQRHLVQTPVGFHWLNVAVFAAMLGSIYLLAHLMYTFIEIPARNHIRNWYDNGLHKRFAPPQKVMTPAA